MVSRAEQYRQLARECLQLANTVPPGEARRTILDMAREWEQLAELQNHATDLRPKE
jgi:hypothetical protein